MKNNTKQRIALGLLGFGIGSLATNLYYWSKEKRSLSSWLIERILWQMHMHEEQAEMVEHLPYDLAENNRKAIKKPFYLVDQKIEIETIVGMQVFVWNDKKDSEQAVIIYIHGGGNFFQPYPTHYATVRDLIKRTDAKVLMPIYFKSPDHYFKTAYPPLVSMYRQLLLSIESSSQITLVGDSSGGGIALGLSILLRELEEPQPYHLALISPWVDLTVNHEELADYEKVDPLMSIQGAKLAGRFWARNPDDLTHPLVSPINGDYHGLPEMTIFVGTHELFYPDILRFVEKLKANKHSYHLYVEEKMNHIYVIYPTREGRKAREAIADIINQSKKTNKYS